MTYARELRSGRVEAYLKINSLYSGINIYLNINRSMMLNKEFTDRYTSCLRQPQTQHPPLLYRRELTNPSRDSSDSSE